MNEKIYEILISVNRVDIKYAFWIIVFGGLLFYGSKIYGDEECKDPLSYEKTLALRGICAVEIVIGHIGVVSKSPVLFLNRKAGILIVGLFFFLSGYGLMYSMQKKKNYMRRFIKCRIPKLLFPAIPVYVIYSNFALE